MFTKRSFFLIGVTLATALAAWLRIWGITGQVVLDDEWHAIHKLVAASYANIFVTFGVADHSIPLTLLYKLMADTVGLAEGRMRALQIICGIALVPVSAWLAWRATDDAPAATLFAFLLSGAPFLVMWSRFARPYAITVLLSVLCVAAVWCWRTRRTWKLAAIAAVTAALSAWFHPISGMYAAIVCLFVFLEDVLASGDVRPRPSWRSLQLGAVVAGAMGLLLAAPVIVDRQSLTAKAGGDQPGFETVERMLAIIWGGIPTPVVFLACAVAGWGVVATFRRDRRLAFYLVALGVIPAALLWLSGALWMQSGHNFLRYQLPLQPLMLFFGSVGMASLVRATFRRTGEGAAWIAAAALSVAYLVATPAIAYTATLGPWAAHAEYHWDYRYRWLIARQDDPPAFYRKLGTLPPGSVTIIEAPFIWEAPYNLLAYYAPYHRQREIFGMLYDLCLQGQGDRIGEIPNDRRFRFRSFVFLDDVAAVRRTGARYLVLQRGPIRHVGPVYDSERCLAKLTELYGPPVEIDSRLAVFDLARAAK